jgi:hypothetical protein
MIAGVAAISTKSRTSPTIGMRSSSSSRGASNAGTATLQNALAATSRAACSAAASAATFAASSRSFFRLDTDYDRHVSHALKIIEYLDFDLLEALNPAQQ